MPFQSWILLLIAFISLGFLLTISFRLVESRSNQLFIVAIFCIVVLSVGGALFLEHSSVGTALLNNKPFLVAITLSASFLFLFFKASFVNTIRNISSRDSDSVQALIDEINSTLTSNVGLEALLTKSARLIEKNIETTACMFYIQETSSLPSRVIGSRDKLISDKDIESIKSIASKMDNKIHSTKLSTVDPGLDVLNKLLSKSKVEIMARLVNAPDHEPIGYMFLAPKSGDSRYTPQDLKVLDVLADELMIAVENSLRFEEIEQFNVTLQKKINTATKELKRNNDKLLALDEAKDEFVSMASHQLRTPLTSIKGYLSMVLEGDAGKLSDTQKQMLGQAFFSSQRMVYLISDLLNVSRLRTGKFIIDAKPVNLADVIEGEIDQLVEGARAKDLTVAYNKPKEFPTLMIDDMKIRQVIMNFTDNAIYYTPSGGKITVKLRETPTTVEFTVHDTGIGVPKNQQHKLFTKFYRADNARKARPDGTGLGIFMAKKVIIAQGGSIIFKSKEGKGSTFGFSFNKHHLKVEQKTKPS